LSNRPQGGGSHPFLHYRSKEEFLFENTLLLQKSLWHDAVYGHGAIVINPDMCLPSRQQVYPNWTMADLRGDVGAGRSREQVPQSIRNFQAGMSDEFGQLSDP
jgi:hypothetical protein